MLSADKLKAYASHDTTADKENWDDQFEGDLTVRTPRRLTETDPLQTIRPPSAKGSDEKGSTSFAAARSPQRHSRQASRDRPFSPPKPHRTQRQIATPFPTNPLVKDELVDDYSDLLVTSDGSFERTFDGLKVRGARWFRGSPYTDKCPVSSMTRCRRDSSIRQISKACHGQLHTRV